MIAFEGVNYYSVKEVAALLKQQELTIRRYIREGRLPAIKRFGKWVISARTIEDFLTAKPESCEVSK